MTTKCYDVVIIGGGPVGMALVIALQKSGLSILLLEARGLPEKDEDPRPLALSHGSRLILERLNVWNKLSAPTPISTIHISNQGSLGRTLITTEDAGVPSLGYVVNYHDLFKTMHTIAQEAEADYIAGAKVTNFETCADHGRVDLEYKNEDKQITAKLLVLADGGRLTAQIKDIDYVVHEYEQWAIVANITTEIPQSGIAYERFTPDGPVAMLPSSDHFALVWTVSPDIAQTVIAMDESVFLTKLHGHFGDRLGKFIKAGKRTGFPLSLKYATPNTSQRIALVGNAAQTLHPVAGQGFNLGLRDAWELANVILASSDMATEIGTPVMLSRFRKKRQIDSNAGRIFTDSLVKLFSNDNILLKNASGMGLCALDNIPPLKRFVARRMIFGARG